MSWSKQVTLWCDEEDCESHRTFSKPTLTEAIRVAREKGWVVRNSTEQYCPDCSSDNADKGDQ